MARHYVVLALVFFVAIVGVASAETQAASQSPVAAPTVSFGPASDNDIIGLTDGSYNLGAAPVGGPVTPGTFANLSPADSPKSPSTALEASAFAGVVASVVVASFFF